MKRKLRATSFDCEDDMEELNVASLHRKESVARLTARNVPNFHPYGYPLAVVLRLRVLQIVCGVSKIVMGSVAFIEERQQLNLGLGIPAGSFSVLAAAMSIHTTRGWSTATNGAVSVSAATVLWTVSICMLLALIIQCIRTILELPTHNEGSDVIEENLSSPRDLVIIAYVQIALAFITLMSAFICTSIDFSA